MATEGILDASVLVSLAVPEKLSSWSESVIEKYRNLGTLELAYYEVANALRSKVAQKEISNDVAKEALSNIVEDMGNMNVYNVKGLVDDAFKLALEYNTSIYDSAYLSLTRKLGSKFITIDLKCVNRFKGTKYYDLFEHPF